MIVLLLQIKDLMWIDLEAEIYFDCIFSFSDSDIPFVTEQ